MSLIPVGVEAQPSARERQSAAEAYDRGTSAFLAEDFVAAARWFETAHRMAPAAAALIQAVRAHIRADNTTRAATLALELQEEYGDNAQAASAASEALEGADAFVRVEVDCEGCALEVDGSLETRSTFFVQPGAEHTVVASFDTGNQTEQVSGEAGQTVQLAFEAPEAVADPDGNGGTDGGEVSDGGGGGVPVAVSIISLVVTAGLGGVLIWSGIDTLDGVEPYEAAPTPEGLEDGRNREARTNWLIAGTSVAAAATLVLLIFTDWGGGDDDQSEPSAQALLDIQADRAILGLRGRF